MSTRDLSMRHVLIYRDNDPEWRWWFAAEQHAKLEPCETVIAAGSFDACFAAFLLHSMDEPLFRGRWP